MDRQLEDSLDGGGGGDGMNGRMSGGMGGMSETELIVVGIWNDDQPVVVHPTVLGGK